MSTSIFPLPEINAALFTGWPVLSRDGSLIFDHFWRFQCDTLHLSSAWQCQVQRSTTALCDTHTEEGTHVLFELQPLASLSIGSVKQQGFRQKP